MTAWTDRLAGRASLLAACVAAVACGGTPPTELVVVVDGTAGARAAVGCLVLEAGPEPSTPDAPFLPRDVREVPLATGVPPRAMPVSFGLAPADAGPSQRVRLRVIGYDACPSDAPEATRLTWRTTRTWFVPGEMRLLPIMLELPDAGSVCEPSCVGTGSCVAAGCVPVEEVDPATLPPVAPGREFDDAGMRMDASIDGGVDAATEDAGGDDAGGVDAGTEDAGGADAGTEDAGVDAGTTQTFDAVRAVPTGISLLGVDGEDAILAVRDDVNATAIEVRDTTLTARAGTARSLVTPAAGDTAARPVAAVVRTAATGQPRVLACGDVGPDGVRFGAAARDSGPRIVVAGSSTTGTRAWLAEFDLTTGEPVFAMVVGLPDADVSCADLSLRLDRDGQSAVLALVGARRTPTATSTLVTTTLRPGAIDALVTSVATLLPGVSGGVPPARFGLVLDVKPPIDVWTSVDVLHRGLALGHAERLRVAPTFDGSGAIYVAASGATRPTGLGIADTGTPGAVLARLGPSASTPSTSFVSSWALPIDVSGAATNPVVTGLASASGGAALSVDVDGPAVPGLELATLLVDGTGIAVEDPRTAAILLVEATTGAAPSWALRRLGGPASLAVRVTGTKNELASPEFKAIVAGAAPFGTRARDDGGWTLPSRGEDTDFALVTFYGNWASGAESFGLHGAVFTMSSDAAGLDVLTNARFQSRDPGAAGSPGLFVAGTPAARGRVTIPWTGGGSTTTSAGSPFVGFLYLR